MRLKINRLVPWVRIGFSSIILTSCALLHGVKDEKGNTVARISYKLNSKTFPYLFSNTRDSSKIIYLDSGTVRPSIQKKGENFEIHFYEIPARWFNKNEEPNFKKPRSLPDLLKVRSLKISFELPGNHRDSVIVNRINALNDKIASKINSQMEKHYLHHHVISRRKPVPTWVYFDKYSALKYEVRSKYKKEHPHFLTLKNIHEQFTAFPEHPDKLKLYDPIDTALLKHYQSIEKYLPTYEEFKYRYSSFLVNPITIPFKFRLDGVSETNFNAGLYFGRRTGKRFVNRFMGQLNESDFNLTYGFVGGVTPISLTSSNSNSLETKTAIGFDTGAIILVGLNLFSVGVVYGFDYATFNQEAKWKYDGKPWVGLAFSLDLSSKGGGSKKDD